MSAISSKAAKGNVAQAVEAFRRGHMVVLLDALRPERGGVVAAAAERTSDDLINFMATHARGLISLALTADRAERLGVDPQGELSSDLSRENYTVSLEAKRGVSTGISASDRARTIQVAIDARTRPEDIVTPGHIFPAIGRVGGVLTRPGWTEASLDLARTAGMHPAATFCHVLDEAGELASTEALADMAETHGLTVLSVQELIAHRRATESFVTQLTQTTLPTAFGEFLVRVFLDRLDGTQHAALTLGEVRSNEPALVRIHSECLTGDVLGSRRCDCGRQLAEALRRIQADGRGAVVYLRQEGRGIGLANKLRAYALQDDGRDTVEANLELGLPADLRDFSVGAQILLALGIHQVKLMTNNPRKVDSLVSQGVEVVERIALEAEPTDDNRRYLSTKKAKLGHLLDKV
jgi:3,4-dihydroxy 2-butanone 4-phosphate synthase/GTP cyclohydrolase II